MKWSPYHIECNLYNGNYHAGSKVRFREIVMGLDYDVTGTITECEQDENHFRIVFRSDKKTAFITFEGKRTETGCHFSHTEAFGMTTPVIGAFMNFLIFKVFFRKKANWQLIRDDMILDNRYLYDILTEGKYPERIPLDKLTARDIQQFYTNLKKSGRLIRTELYGAGLSDQTVRGIHTTLRAALDKAVEEKLIFRNPADSCKPPSARPREMQVLAPEEIQRLLIQAKEDGCYELLLLELATGLRRGELSELRGGELRTKEQIEKEISRIEAVPEKDRNEKRRCEAGYAERYPAVR